MLGYCEEEYDEKLGYVVMDNGSSMMKSGLSGEDAPKVTFSSCVGHSRLGGRPRGCEDCYVGDEAQQKRGILRLKYPLEHGVIQDWDDMEKIWTHTFDKKLTIVLGDPYDEAMEDVRGVLLTEPPMNPKDNRERMTETMFETFYARRFYLESTAPLALLASGRKTGLVVESGKECLRAVPIYDCCTVPGAIRQQHGCGGSDLTKLLGRILCEPPSSLRIQWNSELERPMLESMKESHCRVSLNFAEEVDNFTETRNYELPDGTVLTFHNQLIRCPEALFSPSLEDCPGQPLHQLAIAAADGCPPDQRREMLENILLAGGNTLFQGLPERLQAELELSVGVGSVKVIAPTERLISTWIGGSILASLSAFERMVIDRSAHYDEVGPRIVHQMCHHRMLKNTLDQDEET